MDNRDWFANRTITIEPEKIPKWALALWEQLHAKGADRDEVAMLYELLTRPEMKPVWKTIEQRNHTNPNLTTPKAEVFVHAVRMAYWKARITPYERTKKEHDEWMAEVVATAHKLARLIEGSSLDTFLIDQHHRQAFQSAFSNAVRGHTRTCTDEPRLLSITLDAFAQAARDLAAEDAPIVGHPNTSNAPRACFVRVLTKACREMFSSPLRSVVATTTAIVFGDPNITERQVTRLAP